jgi:hypothetical protein
MYYSGATPSSVEDNVGVINVTADAAWRPIGTGFSSTAVYVNNVTAGTIYMFLNNTNGDVNLPSAGSIIMSAKVCGWGTDPFGSVHSGAL